MNEMEIDELSAGVEGDAAAEVAHAPHLSLPDDHTRFVSIEYPGPIKSISKALASIGGLPHVTSVLNAPPTLDTIKRARIELNLAPGNVYTHPVSGVTSDTGNLVLKVVKRRKRTANGADEDGGVYRYEAIGVAAKTVRFRGMADFQYEADLEDPIVQVASKIRAMDVEGICAFRFDPPSEDFDTMSFIPPPVFSLATDPMPYLYKPATHTVKASVEKHGEETAGRLLNAAHYAGRPVQAVPHASTTLPTGPEEDLSKDRRPIWLETEDRLRQLLAERPVWTKKAIGNQLSAEQFRIMQNHKQAIPMVSYTFTDGPFRELIIRFGYDPRKDPEARFYQRLTFRNIKVSKHQQGSKDIAQTQEKDDHRSHLFDGESLHTTRGNFQLIDITDRLCKKLIYSKVGVRKTCSATGNGWYDLDFYEQIRSVVKRKFVGLIDGERVSDGDCEDLLGDKVSVGVEGKSKTAGGRRRSTAQGEVEGHDEDDYEGVDEDDEEGDNGDSVEDDDDEDEAVHTSEEEDEEEGSIAASGKRKASGVPIKKQRIATAPATSGTKAWQTRKVKWKPRPKPKGALSDQAKAAALRRVLGVGNISGRAASPSSAGEDDDDEDEDDER